ARQPANVQRAHWSGRQAAWRGRWNEAPPRQDRGGGAQHSGVHGSTLRRALPHLRCGGWRCCRQVALLQAGRTAAGRSHCC
ncbi:unnamed protein product, partial [Closterium sp. NIES-53]